jgi:hypothetical protein
MTPIIKARAEYTESLRKGTGADISATYNASIAAATDPKVKAQLIAQKAAFEKLVEEGKASNASDAELIKSNEDSAKTETESLAVANKTLEQLVQLNSENANILDLAKTDPEKAKALLTTPAVISMGPSNMMSPFGMHAKGTKFATGDPIVVGDRRGPEIMTPPRGAQIFPHGILPPATIRGNADKGAGAEKHFNITINASANPQQIANVVQSTIYQMNIG